MEHIIVERSIWIAAARERVWQAITDPTHIAQWLLPPALPLQLKRAPDGTLSASMGGSDIPIATQEQVDAPRSIRSRGLPDGLVATTYTLADENGGTRVTVTLTADDTLPERARQDRAEPSGAGWEKALENLRAQIDGAALPFPEGYIAAMFGYRRTSEALFAIERSIWIAAPTARVWRAITDPAQYEAWFSPGTPWHISALEVGGKFFVREAETGAELYTQTIELIEPPHHFRIRSAEEPSGIAQVLLYSLQGENGGTRLTITHSGYEQAPEATRDSSMEQNAFGFGMMLENVRALCEDRALPYPGGF